MLIFTWVILCSMPALCHREEQVRCGADRLELYLPLIGDRNVALVANHTSVVGGKHLVDTLLSCGVRKSQIQKVFAPEHGFRGEMAAGVKVVDGTDPATGISIVSLYGDHKKPLPEEMAGVDLVIFDLQDVGARFYTYISTLHYVMEACAEGGIPMVVLDRPNPNGGYVDGPVLEPGFVSFVGMHPIPVVYGLTIGELAMMINGEGWLGNGLRCDLQVIPCGHYVHGKSYSMPVNPSPNLTNDHAIKLYPSTCFFEGTVVSEGRGTSSPFEVYGHPDLDGDFTFIPVSIPGISGDPKFRDQACKGRDLREFVPEEGWTSLQLQWLLDAYARFPGKEEFFTPYFEKLAGTSSLRSQIEAGWDEKMIRKSWQEALDDYMKIREAYLIYD